MRTATRPWWSAGQGLKQIAAAIRRGDRRPPPTAAAGDSVARQPVEGYVRNILQYLAVFRFLSFAMGAGLVFGTTPSVLPYPGLVAVVGLVGFYNIYRIVRRFDPATPRAYLQWAGLGVDLVLSVTLILMSRGLDSPFLIYSLSPILTASLLIGLRSSITIASISALCVSGGHIAAGLGLSRYPRVLSGNYLAISLLYAAVCLLMAVLPFVANLNLHRRIRAESLAAEQRRLRREVHDNVAQTLAFLSLKMRRAEERASQSAIPLTARDVREISGVVERVYLSVRDYLDGTEQVDSAGPVGARLAAVVRQWSRDTGLSVNVSLTGGEQDLSPGAKYQLLQIAREALANVAKHAYAAHVWVSLRFTPTELSLQVRDNGRGFAASSPQGHGMDIMRERANIIGATLTIDSTPGEGTVVTVAYPRGM